MVNIGLVVEGSHDYLMIKPLLNAELKARGCDDIVFKDLQPLQDATGFYPDGGWSRVVAWCLDHAGDRIETAFEAPTRDGTRLDLILVHLDGDAAECVAPHTAVAPPGSWTPVSRVNYLTKVIEDWLALNASDRARIVLALPVLETEAWINASSLSDASDSWEAVDAKSPFRSRWNKATHAKLAQHYEAAGIVAASSRELIAARCLSYAAFCTEVSSAKLS